MTNGYSGRNEIDAAFTDRMPKVGDGATYGVGSDSYPATVIKTTAKTVTIQDDEAIVVGGPYQYGDNIQYRYEPNPNGRTMVCRWSAARNRWIADGSFPVSFGHRRRYYDPHV